MAVKGVFSYWWFPIISGVVWTGMLLGLLLEWLVNQHGRRLPTMSEQASIAFISNIGAERLQPLFIVGCVLTSVFLDLAFFSERWLRHNGRLVPNVSLGEKILSILSMVFAIVGTVGLICLSIFRTGEYRTLHNMFLGLFIGGYLISAVFICCEYQRLGKKYREHRMLRLSFWVKLIFILVEFALIVAFGVLGRLRERDAAAVLEWIISFIFTFYAVSFVIDLYPAVRTKNPDARYSKAYYIPSASAAPNDVDSGNGSSSNIYPHDVEMAQNGSPPRAL
ncbi:hypothetical protein N0V84_001541 [Fusarium piperis]|uniref:CWH43-like N-terminal domain-containing protein n=1 Tax=Fusarium piperis TaxID=1435070 RepID=A0A9W9BTT2_9HYPO|nr:hypothetical protein N0V84_001541 [Fusarium piperis]